MLILATTVFIYYTIWTLLLVRGPSKLCLTYHHRLNPIAALRGRFSPDSIPFPASSLGHSHPRHSGAIGLRRDWQFLERGHDPEQPPESSQGEREERPIVLNVPARVF